MRHVNPTAIVSFFFFFFGKFDFDFNLPSPVGSAPIAWQEQTPFLRWATSRPMTGRRVPFPLPRWPRPSTVHWPWRCVEFLFFLFFCLPSFSLTHSRVSPTDRHRFNLQSKRNKNQNGIESMVGHRGYCTANWSRSNSSSTLRNELPLTESPDGTKEGNEPVPSDI